MSKSQSASRGLLSLLGFTGTNHVLFCRPELTGWFQSTIPKWMDVHKGLNLMHLLCATHALTPLGALSAHMPTGAAIPAIPTAQTWPISKVAHYAGPTWISGCRTKNPFQRGLPRKGEVSNYVGRLEAKLKVSGRSQCASKGPLRSRHSRIAHAKPSLHQVQGYVPRS